MKYSAYIILSLAIWFAPVAHAQQAASVSPKVSSASKASPAAPASKFDTKLPIEISSDTLEVLQQQNQAIFKGDVIAVQGTVRLKSDVMVVHYTQKPGAGAPGAPPAPKPEPKPPATPGQDNSPMGAINRIDVSGHVFVATPEEAAQGDIGNYDVPAKTIHLFGSNVVLTRGKNILRGTALEYNLETGRSLLTHENGNAVNTMGPSNSRVRGVFVPDEKPASAKPGDKALPKKTGTDKSPTVPPMPDKPIPDKAAPSL